MMNKWCLMASMLFTAAASASGAPVDVSVAAEQYVKTNVSCAQGKAMVAAQSHSSGIAQISYQPILARQARNTDAVAISCDGNGGYMLNDVVLTNVELATYAMGFPREGQAAEEVQALTLEDAIPVERGLTLSDSKGCAWFVAEVDHVLKIIRPQNPNGSPICAKVSKAK